jgi:cyclic pyranopterin phosphate synthase
MTRLRVDSPIGDVLDRLTILDRKAARLPPERAANCRAEADALREAWLAAGLPEPEAVPEHAALAEVNGILWDVEDRLRAREAAGDFGADFVADARSVYVTNDRRAALKRAVNERFGSAFIEEKIHPHYKPIPAGPRPFAQRTGGVDAPGGVAGGGKPPAPESPLTHLDEAGNAHMVDVGEKAVTRRSATAEGFVRMAPDTRARLAGGPKGDPLPVAQIAGIQAAKRTGELIPLCHPLPLDGVDVRLEPVADGVHIVATARTTGRTGVEMEALTAVGVAALTVYDMLKAVDRGLRIEGIRLLEKTGGRSGTWRAS